MPLRMLAALGLAIRLHAVEIRGIVLDPSARPVEGARVSIANSAAVTGGDGVFLVAAPAPGSYVVRVTKAGFADLTEAIEAPGPANVTLRLAVGTAVTNVTVSAEANHAIDADRTPQPVTIIGRDRLDGRATVLSEALEEAAGVQQLRTGPTLGAAFVRGLAGKNVAVFRDGVRFTTSAQRGGISTFFNLVQPGLLDSVEVLRGPNSAQYGSDSLGGTVGLFTRVPEPDPARRWHGAARAAYGSAAHSFGPSASVSRGDPRASVSAALSAVRSNTIRTGRGIDSHAAVTRFLGLPSTVLGSRLPDTAFTAYGGSFHAQFRPRGNSQWIVHYDRGQQDGGKRYDQLLGGDGNSIADLRNLMLDFAYLRYHRYRVGPFDAVSVTGSYNAQREERVNQGGSGDPLASITHQYEKTGAIGIQSLVERRIGSLEWTGGGDAYFERIAAPSFSWNPANGVTTLVRPRIPDGARYRTHGVFTQASWSPGTGNRVRFSGAIRHGGAAYDSRASRSPVVNGARLWPDDTLSAHALTGRIGSVTWLRPSVSLHGNYSRGFRAPNVTDLGTLGLQGNGLYETSMADLAGRGALVGDRADDLAKSPGKAPSRLRPETSDNFDAGIRIRRTRWQADLGGFLLHLGNSIVSQTLLLPPGAVGQALGEQTIERQIASGAVFVPASNSPVLVRTNFSGARLRGFEHSLRVRLAGAWTFAENVTWIRAAEARTGLPPDIEPGVPPLAANPSLSWRPARRLWFEAYAMLAGRQARLSSLALADRRIGNPRSRSSIQAFFENGARTRGLVRNGVLFATGESLAQVQDRLLGPANSAPQFVAIPGFAVVGVRGGCQLSEQTDLSVDLSNLADRNYRGIGWGVDGPGRGVSIRLAHRF